MKIAVQTEDFDVQAEVAALHAFPKVGSARRRARRDVFRHGSRP